MKLFPYQTKAVNSLFRRIDGDLEDGQTSYEVLKSPTGSGKTVMMAGLIDKLSDLDDQEVCFIWISVGKGKLARQSFKSLRSFLPAHKVSYLSDEFTGGRAFIEQNEVVVLNWELVNSRKNTLMQDGETHNFKDVMANTLYRGLKPILIIDESHKNATTQKSEVVLDIIKPVARIDVSATPSNRPTYTVPYKDVRDQGVVKNSVILNKDVGVDKDEDEVSYVFKSAEIVYQQLVEEYTPFKIKPLKLINVENCNGGVDALEIKLAEDYEAGLGRTIDNGKLAVWTSKRKDNVDNLVAFNSPVEALIFKQAITEGWDCPRACVLVELRANMGETFKQQVVGRILRMPERKHYDNEWLDNAYVFTNDTELKIGVADAEDAEIFKFEAKLRPNIDLELSSHSIKRDWRDIQIADGKFKELLFEYMEVKYGN